MTAGTRREAQGKSAFSRREFLAVAGVGLGGALLAACGGTAAPPSASASAAPASAKPGGSGIQVGSGAAPAGKPKETPVLVVALQTGGLSNDPARSTAIEDWAFDQQVYNGLLRFKPGGVELEADLAASWDVSKDGKQYTFKLKKGIEFHGGFGEMTAEDVKFSMERIDDPKVKSVNRGFLSMVQSIQAVDKYTIAFSLKQPYSPFLSVLALSRPTVGAIVSKAAADKLGNDTYSEHPIGTGPFVFVDQVPNQSRTLSRNDKYHEGPAYAKQLKLLNMPDQTTMGLAVEKGEVHIGNARGVDTFQKYKSNPAAQFLTGVTFNTVGIQINTRKPPFDKVEVRQALALAIDRAELVEGALAGIGLPANGGMLIPGMVGYDESIKPPPYDPAKAKSMLAAAGVTNLKVSYPVYTGTDWAQTTALMKEQMRKAGIDMSALQLERATLAKGREDKASDGTIISLTTGADPDPMMRYYTTAQFPPGLNYCYYTGVDDQVAASESALTQADREAAIKKVQQKLAQDLPELPMYHQKSTVLAAKNLQGYQLDPLGGYWLYRMWLA